MHIIKQQGLKDMLTRQQNEVRKQEKASIAAGKQQREEQLFEIYKKHHPQRYLHNEDNFKDWKQQHKSSLDRMLTESVRPSTPVKPVDVAILRDSGQSPNTADDIFTKQSFLLDTPLRRMYETIYPDTCVKEYDYRAWLRTHGKKKLSVIDSMLSKADIDLSHLGDEVVLNARRAAVINEEAILSYCSEVYSAKSRDCSFRDFVRLYACIPDILEKRGDISYFKSFHENTVKLLSLTTMLNSCRDIFNANINNDTGKEIPV